MMKMNSGIRKGQGNPIAVAAFAVSALLLVGCQENAARRPALSPSTAPPADQYDLSAETGVPMSPAAAAENMREWADTEDFAYRSDPFALLPEERTFDLDQHAERLISTNSWSLEITPTLDMDEDAPPVLQPLPVWRLSGIIVSNGVLALLDMGGRTIEIRPGTRIPGTPWTVVSIDEERAILKRDDNVLPSEFAVELTGPMVTIGGGGGGGNNNGRQGDGRNTPGLQGGSAVGG